MTKKYLVLPVTAYADQFDLESEAFDKAKKLASQFESDFVVIEAKFLGVYQRVTPIFSADDPTETRAVGSVGNGTTPQSRDLDDIPF